MKKIITAPWGKIRLSVAPQSLRSLTGEEPVAMISVEVWRRGSNCVDSGLMRADELEALGSEEVRQWLHEVGAG